VAAVLVHVPDREQRPGLGEIVPGGFAQRESPLVELQRFVEAGTLLEAPADQGEHARLARDVTETLEEREARSKLGLGRDELRAVQEMVADLGAGLCQQRAVADVLRDPPYLAKGAQ